MEVRRYISEMFEKYVVSLKERDIETMKGLLSDELEVRVSVSDDLKGKDTFISRMRDMQEYDYSRYQIANFVVRQNDETIISSAYINVLLAKETDSALYPFQYGGKYVMTYEKSDKNEYRIKKILFDLDWTKGNTEFKKEWLFMDYEKFGGHSLRICSELDSPWAAVPNSKIQQPVEQEVKECLAKIAFGYDCLDTRLVVENCKKDVSIWRKEQQIVRNLPELLEYQKNQVVSEKVLEHAYKVLSVRIDEKKAEITGMRLEPHRIKSKSVNKATRDITYYNAEFTAEFEYDEHWKMTKLKAAPKIVEVREDRKKYYLDVV